MLNGPEGFRSEKTTDFMVSSVKSQALTSSERTNSRCLKLQNLGRFLQVCIHYIALLPPLNGPIGRSWKAAELRNKSFKDLHTLWYVSLREKNLMATQKEEVRRMGVTSVEMQVPLEKVRRVRYFSSLHPLFKLTTRLVSENNGAHQGRVERASSCV